MDYSQWSNEELAQRLGVYETERDVYRQKYSDTLNELDRVLEKIKDEVTSRVSCDELSKDSAKAFLEEFGIEAKKIVNVSGTVSFSGTVELSIFDDEIDTWNAEAESLEITYDGETVDLNDYSIENIEED